MYYRGCEMLRKLLRILPIKESGQVLIIVLVFLALGSIILLPLLTFTGSGLKAGMVYESKAAELYAADAGIEDALWNIRYSMLDSVLTDYDEYTYENVWDYDMSDNVNDKNVNIGIENMWMLYGIEAPSSYTARNIIEGTVTSPPKLIVTGVGEVPVDGNGQFEIKITFTPNDGEEDALQIARIAVWLPAGYTYVEGSSQLDNPANAGEAYYDVPEIIDYNGGTVIIWDYNYKLFTGNDSPYQAPFPGVNPDANALVSTINFDYTTDQQDALEAVAWVVTGGVTGVSYTWDADVKIFGIYSTATTPDTDSSTDVEAYAIKSEMREMVNTISGDYIAAGNSLMTDEHYDSYYIRDTLLSESSSEVTSIPDDAQIVLAYLYWSSWFSGIDEGTAIYTENCSSYDDTPSSWPYVWYRNSVTGNQTKNPTGDGTTTGTWSVTPSTPSSFWSKVDETTPNDSDYITGTASSGTLTQTRVPTGDGGTGYNSWSSSPFWSQVDETTPNDNDYITGTRDSGDYILFNYSAFSIPEGATISGITVYVRARDASSGTNDIRPAITVGGVNYLTTASSNNPGTSFNTYSYNYTTNPRTGLAWTVEDVNGTGSNPLQKFGANSSDLNPDMRVSMVYAEVSYTIPGGSIFFTFPSFTVPAGVSINNITVYVRAIDASSGTNDIRPAITVGGVNYLTTAGTNNPGSSYTTYSYAYTTNPKTGLAWTIEDINGTGSNPLQQFGVYSNDLNPGVRVSMVYATVNWTGSTHWDVNNNMFRCSGGGTVLDKTLTLDQDIDLSDYAGQDVKLSCDISDSNAGAGDILYYQLYNGSNWSSQQEIYQGDYNSDTYTITISDSYLTEHFRVRFYWNSTSTSKYVYLDNIAIKVIPTIADTSINFKINNGLQTYNTTLVAENSQEILTGQNTSETSDDGCAYSCFSDVTDLVNARSRQGVDGNYTGNATYTVGGVSGDTGWQLSYAGWSLVLIYASAETAGHMMYLYDAFTYADDYTSLDFDGDGVAGGDISGFLVPEQITGETNSAKITIFVGEGDEWITGDYVSLNGTKLWDGINCTSNSSSSPNNVWNGRSTAFSADGVDVDTFQATWASHVLEPGDTTAHIDLYTAEDNWNLIYIIISFRSETTTGGTFIYLVR
jgi:hypothetical protein